MNAIKFKQANVNVAESQDEYQTLPALQYSDDKGTMVTCWSMNIFERIRVLFTGKVWLTEWTFGNDIRPRYMTTKIKEAVNLEETKQ